MIFFIDRQGQLWYKVDGLNVMVNVMNFFLCCSVNTELLGVPMSGKFTKEENQQ